MHFIAEAKLDKILKIPLAVMLPRAMKRFIKIYRNFEDAITQKTPREYT